MRKTFSTFGTRVGILTKEAKSSRRMGSVRGGEGLTASAVSGSGSTGSITRQGKVTAGRGFGVRQRRGAWPIPPESNLVRGWKPEGGSPLLLGLGSAEPIHIPPRFQSPWGRLGRPDGESGRHQQGHQPGQVLPKVVCCHVLRSSICKRRGTGFAGAALLARLAIWHGLSERLPDLGVRRFP